MEYSMKNKMNMLSIIISVLFFNSAGGITVKWGTNDGPIVPPTPTPPPTPPQKPYKSPAPVWEDLTDDIPNPNPYVPSLPDNFYFRHTKPVSTISSTIETKQSVPQIQPHHTRYTNVIYRPKSTIQTPSTTLAPAKAFVNAYARPTSTTPAPSSTYRTVEITPRQENYNNNNINNHGQENRYQTIEDSLNNKYNVYNNVPQLTVQYNPGYGLKYVTQVEDKDPRKYFYNNYKQYKTHDEKYNAIETNDVFGDRIHQNDLDLSFEKHMAQRLKKSPDNQFYVPQQSTNYYSQPQLFFPAGFIRH